MLLHYKDDLSLEIVRVGEEAEKWNAVEAFRTFEVAETSQHACKAAVPAAKRGGNALWQPVVCSRCRPPAFFCCGCCQRKCFVYSTGSQCTKCTAWRFLPAVGGGHVS
jgi:hypothetical protein